MMSDELEFMVDEFAFHLAHRDGQKLTEAERLIRQLIEGAPGVPRRRRALWRHGRGLSGLARPGESRDGERVT
jgi:hypothetical protein